jgi:hypothetical protein
MKQKSKQRRRKHTQPTQKRRTINGPRGMIKGNKSVRERHNRTGLIATDGKLDDIAVKPREITDK